jgi:outer membrane protein OmpA-like peptidoglycan-associated protein
MKNVILKALLIIVIAVPNALMAQSNLNFYRSKSLVQTTLLNPAHKPNQNFSLGLVDGTFQVYVPGITAYDIFRNDETYRQTFNSILLSDKINLDNIQTSTSLNLMLLGFKLNKSYVSFGMQLNSTNNLSIPKDFAAIGIFGNTGDYFGKSINFNNLKVNTTTYAAVHAGFNREFFNKLTIGVRGKYLIGLFDAQINKSNGFFKTDSGDLNVYKINASLDYELQAAGIDRFIDFGNGGSPTSLYNDAVGKGFAWDFGIDYKINKKMSVSVSILDIGGINWNQAKTYAQNFNFQFEGFINPDFDSIGSLANNLVDSIKELARPKETAISYRRNLNPKFFVGYNYQLNNNSSINLVGYGEKQQDKFITGFGANFSQRILQTLDIRAGVTKYSELKPALSIGLALHLGPLTIYGNSDQVLNNLNYSTTNFISNRVGLNLNIGNLYDKDNDGVPNRKDKCKKQAGLKEFDGCESIDTTILALNAKEAKQLSKINQDIRFEKGTNKLDTVSYKALDQLVQLMQVRQESLVQIDVNPTAGETKSIGEDISMERANILKAYLVSKGIDQSRIFAYGLGSNLKGDKKPELPKKYERQVIVKLLKK